MYKNKSNSQFLQTLYNKTELSNILVKQMHVHMMWLAIQYNVTISVLVMECYL